MKISKAMLSLAAATAVLCSLTTPASASFTHYYYDAQGRVLGALSTADEQRTSTTDSADNPSYLHVFSNNGPTTSTLPLYGALIADQALTSADGRFTFNVQEDGNLVVYEGTTALWSSATSGNQPGWFTVGGNGNLVFYGPSDNVIWASNTSGSPPTNTVLTMQSDGNLVLTENGTAVWSTNTGGH